MIAWLALSACQEPDPELVALARAFSEYDRGRAALEAGRPADAVAALDAALAVRPGDPLLGAWRAHALAESGDVAGAVKGFDAVLEAWPDFTPARLLRGTLRLQLGDVDGAATDVKRAVGQDWLAARSLRLDPVIGPWLEDPRFAALPRESLRVAVQGPEGSVFIGSEAMVRIGVLGADDDPIHLDLAGQGPWELASVTESTRPTTDGPLRDLRLGLRAKGAGRVEVAGQVVAGPWRAPLPSLVLESVAPPGTPVVESRLVWATPSEVLAGRAVPSAFIGAAGLVVVVEPGDDVAISPQPSAPPVRYEREGVAVAFVFPDVREAVSVEVRHEGELIRRGPPDPEAAAR